MIVRLRNYANHQEAAAEWARLGLPLVAEGQRDLYDLMFFFAESICMEEVEEMAYVTEELGGDAYRFGGHGVTRAMLVFEHGVLQSPGCRLAPDDRLQPLWGALSNYLSPEVPPWRLARREVRLDRPLVMGILNVTPDSFSDGGLFLSKDDAVRRGLEMIEQGADLVDVGGESTRPYADPVTEAEERGRVVPVIEELASRSTVPISVDTRHPEVAEAALEAGAEVVNDVSGLRHPSMVQVVSRARAGAVIMHMLGDPRTMQDRPFYEDVVGDISLFLEERMGDAVDAGVAERAIMLDPGIGFGKSVEHNLQIVMRLREFRCLGRPLLLGASRKGFIGKVLGKEAKDRKEGSLAVASVAMMNGANVLRVHDVKETVMVARMVDAVHRAQMSSPELR